MTEAPQIESVAFDFVQFCRQHIRRANGQLMQDLLVLWLFEGRNSGTFLDIGAADGHYLSNTLLLEEEGWTGVLVEPNPIYIEPLSRRRSPLIAKAVWSGAGESVMLRHVPSFPELSKLKDVQHDNHDRSGLRDDAIDVEVAAIAPDALMAASGLPAPIDYLSLDIEGGELAFLEGLDLGRQRFGVATIEHNFGEARGVIHALMQAHGYIRVFEDFSAFDDWYVDNALWAGRTAAIVPAMPTEAKGSEPFAALMGAIGYVGQPIASSLNTLLSQGEFQQTRKLAHAWRHALPEHADVAALQALAEALGSPGEGAETALRRALVTNPRTAAYAAQLAGKLESEGLSELAAQLMSLLPEQRPAEVAAR